MGELADHAGRTRERADFLGDRAGDRALQLQREPSRSHRRTAPRTACARCAPARSPSTIAASKGPWARAAKSAAPASPPLPPLVDTRMIVRRVSRVANTRASSSSAAVPESSACAPRASGVAVGEDHDRRGIGRARALGDHRGTASVRRRSSGLGSGARANREAAAGRAAEAFRAPGRCAPRALRRPALPGRRSGNAAARLLASASARAPLNASGASVEVSGAPALSSEKAAIASASRTGTKAAR